MTRHCVDEQEVGGISVAHPPLNWTKKLALLLLVSGLVACSADSPARLTTLTGPTMGTSYTVKITDLPPGCNPDRLQAGIEQILVRIDAQMSTYNPASEVSRFNAERSTDWMAISTDTLLVIDEALRIARLTHGAFDMTVEPLVRLWGFGPAVPQQLPPAQEQITGIVDSVDYTHIQTRPSPPAVRKTHADIAIDLSAIAKGFGVDKIAEYLSAAAIDNYLVEIGGELRGRGYNPQAVPWQVAIEQPLAGRRSVQRVVRLADRALATSGHYRNFFEYDTQRYAHIIDPKTGRPVTHSLASVSVLSRSTMVADGMATALMVLGPDAGIELAKRENLAAFFIVQTENSFVEISTPEFDQYLIRQGSL